MNPTNNNDDCIEALEADYLYKHKSQLANAGNGLYTAIAIYKDETVAFFCGEILTREEAKQRAEEGNDKYFINLLDGTIMDSMHIACMAKYANDAEGFTGSGFKNNTCIALDDNGHVCIKALRNIKVNEELFCGYGKKYWKKHS